MQPLYELLKDEARKKKFIWTESCHKAFTEIKTILTTYPILAIYNQNEPCYLFTDASRIGIGAVLKQKQSDNELHPIGYFSRKLLPYQRNYSVSELECLAIVEAVNYWYHYLLGKQFSIYTNHKALKYLQNMKNLNSRLAKWALALDMYKCEIFYKEGKDNVEADCLSRNPIEFEIHNNQKYIKSVNLFCKTEVTKSINLINKEQIIQPQKETLNKIQNPQTLELDLNLIQEYQKQVHEKLKKTKLIDGIIYKFDKNKKRI